jgi:heptosyltransferase-2
MHLAAARGARVVGLFGSTVPELGFSPLAPGAVVLGRPEPCRPCTVHGRDRCPRGHFRCLGRLEPADVAAAARAASASARGAGRL